MFMAAESTVETPTTMQMPVAGGAATIGSATGPGAPPPGAPRLLGGRKRPKELVLQWIFGLCALVSVATTFGIILVLFTESLPFFRHVSVGKFLTGREWTPLFEPANFGVLPLICGTFLVAMGAAVFALPMGLMAAIYLSEYAAPRTRNILKPLLEILAGVPTVVYGYFALIFITPLLQSVIERSTPFLQRITGNPDLYPSIEVFNALSASIAIAIMTLPLVSSLCEDALHVVPQSLREGSYALGATKMEVSTKVVVPAALSGIAASFILAISRAVGETMIVAIAAGATPKMTLNPLESIQTMTGYIVQVALGDVPHGSIGYQTIFAVGLLLFCITVMMNMASIALVRKYRQKYD
jgi:phosphate transport system permease protein